MTDEIHDEGVDLGHLDEDDLYDLDERLLISRPCTVEDLANFTPDMTDDERAAMLAQLHATGAEVTYEVTTRHPASDIVQGTAGIIMGPPGSARFLRTPGDGDTSLIDEHNKALMQDGRTEMRSFGSPE